MSLSLYTVIAEGIEKKFGNDLKAAAEACSLQCTGGPGAQVALLQSLILPAARSPYTQNQNSRGDPVDIDKPHTRISRLNSFVYFAYFVV